MKLLKIRSEIDKLDYRIVKLLSERMELSLKTSKHKETVFDEEREKEVLKNLENYSSGLPDKDQLREIYRHILKVSRIIQDSSYIMIGFQGEHGANSESAAKIFNQEYIPVPYTSVKDVFDAVENKEIDYGILPVENSIQGGVSEVNDEFIIRNLRITAEVNVPVKHALLCSSDTDYRDIKIVYSHPQALAQCRDFLLRNNLDTVPYYDTAGAARMISEKDLTGSAALAPVLCAELYNLKVIKEDVSDIRNNSTRFFVISKNKPDYSAGDKCSAVFLIPDNYGSLHTVLKHFSDNEINLLRIESRPDRRKRGSYAFIIDFVSDLEKDEFSLLLEKVSADTESFKFLGSYRESEI